MTISKKGITAVFFVLLSLMNVFEVSSVFTAAVLSAVTFLLLIHSRFFCPGELRIYLLWGLLSFSAGILHSYPVSYIMRAAFYYLNGVLPIVFGFIFAKRCGLKEILKYIWWIELASTVYGFFLLVRSGSFGSMMAIRQCLDADLYSLEFFFPIYTIQLFFQKEYVKSKRVDRVVWGIQLLRLLLCFSRTAVIGTVVGLIVQYSLLDRSTKANYRNVTKALLAMGFLLLLVMGVSVLLPKETLSVYLNKLLTVSHEISIEHDFSDYGSALENWRSYEIYSAVKQFRNGGLLQKIIGTGFGGLVKVDYMSSAWAGMEFYSQGGIPILHNGYFSALSFGGMIGFVCYLYLLVGSCWKALKRRKQGCNRCANTVISLVVMMACNTYVINGLYVGTAQMVWGVLFAAFYYNSVTDDHTTDLGSVRS